MADLIKSPKRQEGERRKTTFYCSHMLINLKLLIHLTESSHLMLYSTFKAFVKGKTINTDSLSIE